MALTTCTSLWLAARAPLVNQKNVFVSKSHEKGDSMKKVITRDKNVVHIGDTTIRVTGKNKDNMAATIERILTNRLGSVFCPECGSPNVYWRHGVHFENEKRCGSCFYCWEPE